MKHSWYWMRKVLAVVLAVSLGGAAPLTGLHAAAEAAPIAEEETVTVSAYGMATADEVIVRKQPSTSANYWFKIDSGFVCEILSTVVKNDVVWYKVNSTHPTPNGRTYIGYVKAAFFRPLTADETSAYLSGSMTTATPTVTPTPTPNTTATLRPSVDDTISSTTDSQFNTGIMTSATPANGTSTATPTPQTTYSTGEITASGTNLRLTPSMEGEVIGQLNSGTVVTLLTIPDAVDSNHWYYVRYNGQTGYVLSTFIRVLTVSATPTPAASVYGTVKLIYDSANLRDSANGTTKTVWQGRGTTLTVAGSSQYAGGYTWYPVYYGVDNQRYYVRGDVVEYTPGSGSVTPTATPAASSGYGYVLTTSGGLNLRLSPSGETIVQIPRNVVLTCIGNPVQPSGSSYVWYYVRYNGMAGYVRGDFVRVCDAEGNALGSSTVLPTAAPTAEVYSGYIKLTKGGVNLRKTPAGTSQGQYEKGLILPIVGATVTSGSSKWYYVRTPDGKTGYIRNDCAMLCDMEGAQVTATPAPTATTTVSGYGYVQITKVGTNLRGTIAGETIHQLKKGTVWPLIGSVIASNGVTWYPISAEGYTGFVRGDCAYQLSSSQVESYLAGNGVPEETPAPTDTIVATSTYVQTTVDYVNLRQSASRDSTSKAKVRTGTVLTYNATSKSGTSTWYRIVYNGQELWVLGSCVKVMTQAEYEQWRLQNPDTATPQPNAAKGYIVTTSDGVNVRSAANGSTILSRVSKGTVLPYYQANIKAGSYTWYQVRLSNGTDGYIRSDFASLCNESGGALPTATPAPTSGATSTSKPTATYTTLRLGSSGDAVTRLVQELIAQGYYTGSVTSSYTSEVQAAVRAFQAANGLTVDGIAGKLTQHALFGTVEPGTVDYSDYTFQFYPAEKIDWFTGGIQQLWAKGASYKVYDVQTGIVWWARRWSGASHCDIEPLTAEDTARLCQIYGVNNAQEIYDKNLWQRRPCLVTIGTRTFACSLYGMPHNPDGDTIPDNDMTGQICMHFTNSKGHESGKVDTYHQQAIEYAWLNCPAGHK